MEFKLCSNSTVNMYTKLHFTNFASILLRKCSTIVKVNILLVNQLRGSGEMFLTYMNTHMHVNTCSHANVITTGIHMYIYAQL